MLSALVGPVLQTMRDLHVRVVFLGPLRNLLGVLVELTLARRALLLGGSQIMQTAGTAMSAR
jgi:hypothetical protein